MLSLHLACTKQSCRDISFESVILGGCHNSRSTLAVLATCAVCATLFVSPSPAQADHLSGPAQSVKLRILFPAYANPHTREGDAMWKKFAELSRRPAAGLELEIIFNPASGPGQSRDPNYLRDDGTGPLADVQGLRIYGYVTTSYAKRTIAQVKSDIDQYASGFYAGLVAGIFFDETSSHLNTAAYYRELSQYAHHVVQPRSGKPVITISNPGIGEVQPPVDPASLQAYATAMDRIVVFENEAKAYRDAKPALVNPFLSPHRLAHIVHTQTTWDPSLVAKMRDRGAANVFITDATMPNPYNRLPVYFDQLYELVADMNRSQ